jgi:hypothetical protein
MYRLWLIWAWAVGAELPAQVADTYTQPPELREVYLGTFTDATLLRYHNFSLLPNDACLAWGAVGWVPVLRSGTDLSLGFGADARYGFSVLLENIRLFSLPVYLTATAGAGAGLHSERRFGLMGGLGAEYYSYRNNGNGPSFQVVRPVALVQLNFRSRRKLIYARYSSLVGEAQFTRHSVVLGSALLFDLGRPARTEDRKPENTEQIEPAE